MTYRYKTRFGTFIIKPLLDSPERVGLWMDDELLGTYHSPRSAADDVYTQHSNHDGWDAQPPVIEPADLTEWIASA